MTEAVEIGREIGEARVHVRAPGKINVYLGVGEVMSDGYHEVATAYHAVSLYEEIYASEPGERGASGASGESGEFTVSFRGPVDTSALRTDDSNLALRAARMLATHTGYTGGVRLEIEKHVPIAGGMGGGSADAAGTLVACDALWGTAVPREELHELAARLGADVPFALAGGTAIGTGRGEELSAALAHGTFQWVLALPEIELSTPEVYAELDRHRERHRAELGTKRTPVVEPAVLQALRAGDPHLLADVLANDLQAAAIHLAPQLAGVLETGERAGALAGLVSGSGPTVAFLAEDRDGALDLQIALSAAGLHAHRVTGPVHGARVVG